MRLREHRKDNVFISTVKVTFLKWFGEYETAVSIDNKPLRILEGYDTEEEAIKGHNKYKNMSKEELINFEYIG